MKIKVSNHKLNVHCRGSPRGSRAHQHAYCLRYAHSQHIESHLGKKQQQAKIPIAFLFSQLPFNNVTSHALFYGGHLVMPSKRCAVQNQGITLNGPDFPVSLVEPLLVPDRDVIGFLQVKHCKTKSFLRVSLTLSFPSFLLIICRNPLYQFDFIYNLTPAGINFKRNSSIVARKADEIIRKRKKNLSEQVYLKTP